VTGAGRRGVSVGILIAALVTAGAAVPRSATAQPPVVTIKELTVEGNRRVQEAVILGAVKSKVGAPFNPALLSDDLRAIFALGFFDDAQMRVEDFEGGVKVTFVVVERPFIRDVDFVGNQKISTKDLQEKVDIRLGGVYNPVDVQRAREKLLDFYQEEGYFEAEVTPDTEKFPDGDVRVTFSINEGRKITIDRIVFHGNHGLSARQLKGALATQERQYYILRGTVQRQKLEEDVERLLSLYNDHGFVQARVDPPEVKVDRQRARVTIEFTVVEGPQYRIGDVRVAGVTLLPESEVRRQVIFKSGDVYSRTKLRDSIRGIVDLYSTIGHASADVLPKTEQHADTNLMDVLVEVTEGPEVYVERINITGNTRSQDKILRREIPMVEGDLFTLQKLQRARQRLVNLGYFDTVNAATQPGSDKTRIIVNVEVTERPTGLFSIGGGYSSVDSFIGTVDLSQRNFLGRGWEVSARLRAGANTQQGTLSFTEPWLFDQPLSAGADLFNVRRQFTEYHLDSLGAGVRLSHPFAEFARWHLGYRIESDDVSHLIESASDALKDQAGTHVTSVITTSLTRDSRDNSLLPTKGSQAFLNTDFAGLGGDFHYIKIVGSVSYFRPIWLGHVLSGRAEAGHGFSLDNQEFPIFERFYLGGPNTLRGFKFRHVSPVDDQGTRVGGDTELLGNVEYIVPLPFNIRVAVFLDVGNAYGFGTKFDPTNVRSDIGGGVRWNSPFGPIRIDYGIKLDRKHGEDLGALQFSVGSPF
jgi:outer membrane protein insertion porin family